MNKVQEIPIGMIIAPADRDAARKVGIEELAESIKAVGLINALTVRELCKDKYSIIAGRRRYWACKMAGIEKVTCAILEAGQQNQAAVIEITENLHRVQLTPMQEAEAIQKLRGLKHSDESIAADLGMTRQFVARRAKLLDLSANWKKALGKPAKLGYRESAVHLWPVACLEMIARYPESKQDELFERLGMDPEMTVENLKGDLGMEESKLGSAIWDLQDATLCPAAGACAVCPKRAGAQPLLFSDDADPTINLNKDTCLDKDCWKQKHKAFIERKVREKQKEHPDLVKISSGGARGHTLGSYQYDAAKKEDKGSVPALRVDGPKAGTITYVKVKKQQLTRTSSKAAEKKKTPEDLAKEREDRRWKIVTHDLSNMIRAHDLGEDVDDLRSILQSSFTRARSKDQCARPDILITQGTVEERLRLGAAIAILAGEDNWRMKWADVTKLLAEYRTMKVEDLLTQLWKATRQSFSSIIDLDDFRNQDPEALRSGLEPFLALAGVAFDDLWAKAMKEVPEPKAVIEKTAEVKSIPAKKSKTKKATDKENIALDGPAPHAINEHDVFTNPIRIDIPLLKTLKCTASIMLAQGPDGKWYHASHFAHSGGMSSGLPHYDKKKGCESRKMATGRALECLLGSITSHIGTTGTGEASVKRLQRAFAAVQEYAKTHGATA